MGSKQAAYSAELSFRLISFHTNSFVGSRNSRYREIPWSNIGIFLLQWNAKRNDCNLTSAHRIPRIILNNWIIMLWIYITKRCFQEKGLFLHLCFIGCFILFFYQLFFESVLLQEIWDCVTVFFFSLMSICTASQNNASHDKYKDKKKVISPRIK